MAKPDWITVSPKSGTGGGEVQITASPNGIEARSGTVTVRTASGLTKTVSVSQSAGIFNIDTTFVIDIQNNDPEGGRDFDCGVYLYSGEKLSYSARGETISLGTTPSLNYNPMITERANPPQNWSKISVSPSMGRFTYLRIMVGATTVYEGTPESQVYNFPIDPPQSYELADEYAGIDIKGTILVE